MNNQTSIESQLKAGIVFTARVLFDSGANYGYVTYKVWRSKCRHYKLESMMEYCTDVWASKPKGKYTDRVGLKLAIEVIQDNKLNPILPPTITPKTALQSLYDALKVKINACFKALELIQKLYKNVMERDDKSQLVHNRLSSLLDYKSILVNVKHRNEG